MSTNMEQEQADAAGDTAKNRARLFAFLHPATILQRPGTML